MLDPTGNSLERYMNLLSTRQKVIASNIANADTPGYKTRDIDFQSEFHSALNGPANPMEVSGLKINNDGNNVNLDREAQLLAENAMRFNIATQLMKGQFNQMKMAIEEGKNG